jgi:hypothetical protein
LIPETPSVQWEPSKATQQHGAKTMALTKKEQVGIAELVNGIMVAEIMFESSLSKDRAKRTVDWQWEGYSKTIELADTYGIKLPTLQRAREYIATVEDWRGKA